MKILIATGLYPPESGGPATHTLLMEERLPALGFKIEVLPFRKVRHLPKGVRHIAYMRRCVTLLRKNDIIFAQDTVSVGLPAALAALLAHKPLVVRVPGDYVWEQASQRFGAQVSIDEFQGHYFGLRVALLRAVQRFVVRRAALVIAPSAYLRGIILGWGADPARVKLVYNGIKFPVPTEPPRERPQGFLVVSVGRRVPWKGFDALERVVARESRWSLHISDSDTRPRALGWIQGANVFVLNSFYEGLSHTLIEAMSLGIPIVATRVGGNPELIAHEKHGLLIEAGDEDALYAAIRRLEDNPDEARRFGVAAAERAKEFSVDYTINALAAALRRL